MSSSTSTTMPKHKHRRSLIFRIAQIWLIIVATLLFGGIVVALLAVAVLGVMDSVHRHDWGGLAFAAVFVVSVAALAVVILDALDGE